jgi:hypothetical protein
VPARATPRDQDATKHAEAPDTTRATNNRARRLERILPTFTSAMIALAYVLIAPRSEDLAAHLLRAKLFAADGWFGIWNNWWYGGHNLPGYSVLFPPAAALTTPQLAAAIACPASTALFDSLVRRRYGEDAWVASLWFGVATTATLFSGRLTFAFGLLPAVGTALALQRRRPGLAVGLAVLTALASPVDALFAALAGAACAVAQYLETRSIKAALPGLAVVVGALGPVLALGVMFPEGGTEPFAFSALWPIVLLSVAGLLLIPKRDLALRAGIALYALGCIAAYTVSSPVGSNATRLAPLVAGPIAALLWWPRPRTRRAIAVLAVAAVPLLYLQWQAPVRDVRTADDNGEVTTAYFQPLIDYLSRQAGAGGAGGGPFRIEIPFTTSHWEAYVMAPRFPLARGWERQLDTKYNDLFYGGPLTPATYEAWLHELAVRFVAVSDADIDYSAKAEVALIDRGLPYLRLVLRTRHWRVYEVSGATPIVQGAATLETLGPNYMQLKANHAGTAYIRVRYSPYWAVVQGSGCVAPRGGFTELTVRRPGPMRVAIRFSLSRVGARSLRCS